MNPKLKTTFKNLGVTIACLGFIYVALLLVVRNLPDVKEVNEFETKFVQINIGDTEKKVLSILGSPDKKLEEFHLGQVEGFEEVYAKANKTNSEYYLIWHKGIDYVFTVGVKNGAITIRESGGT